MNNRARHLEPVTRPRETRLDQSFRRTWVIIGVILAALSAGAGYGVKASKVLDKKADASTVATYGDRLDVLETKVGTLDDRSAWQMDFDLQAAKHWGIETSPTPTPRPMPISRPTPPEGTPP